MKLKLECTLRLKSGEQSIDIGQDINILDLDVDSMNDETIIAFFNRLRANMKTKYLQTILNLCEVDIKEVKD